MDGHAMIVGRRSVGNLLAALMRQGSLNEYFFECNLYRTYKTIFNMNGYVGGSPLLCHLKRIGYCYAMACTKEYSPEYQLDMQYCLIRRFSDFDVTFGWQYARKGSKYWATTEKEIWRQFQKQMVGTSREVGRICDKNMYETCKHYSY